MKRHVYIFTKVEICTQTLHYVHCGTREAVHVIKLFKLEVGPVPTFEIVRLLNSNTYLIDYY